MNGKTYIQDKTPKHAHSPSPVAISRTIIAQTATAGATVNSASAGRSVAGKLIVQCVGLAGTPPWVFYLHGVWPPT